jgi:hypothetical protein
MATAIEGPLLWGFPMESDQKNPYLFYFIITLILLGFIASLALPLKAQEHRLSDAGLFTARDTVTDNLPLSATATGTADRLATAHNAQSLPEYDCGGAGRARSQKRPLGRDEAWVGALCDGCRSRPGPRAGRWRNV